jgi:hypothetical protein
MTETQILNQVNVNYDAIDKVAGQIERSRGLGQTAALQRELKRLWQAQQYWANEYKRVTGHGLILVQPMILTDSLAEELTEVAKQKAASDMKKKLKDAIAEVEREQIRVFAMLQDQYDISVSFQNALFSHWTRMGAGLNAKHPIFVKKQIQERNQKFLSDARVLIEKGKYEEAWKKISLAAGQVKWGADFLNWWMDQLEKGAKRAEAGIKVSAALATLVVAAPLELGILATMGVATVGEGALQGTLLAAKKIDGKETITPEDVKKAVLETVIAGGTAGIGAGAGKLVAHALGSKVAAEILKRNPTAKEVEFVTKRIEQYLAANSAAILKKLTKLDGDPDWNWWYMIITPMINPVAIEMSKEQDLNKLLTQ